MDKAKNRAGPSTRQPSPREARSALGHRLRATIQDSGIVAKRKRVGHRPRTTGPLVDSPQHAVRETQGAGSEPVLNISTLATIQIMKSTRCGYCRSLRTAPQLAPHLSSLRPCVVARAKRARVRDHRRERFLPVLFDGFAAGFRPSPLDFASAERWAA